MHSLQIVAGKRAYSRIRERGFQAKDVQVMLGASGGPKWFVLSHLDQELARNCLPKAPELQLVGSSIGAWRMACHAAADPVAALQRLESSYLNQSFPKGMTAQQVSDQCELMLKEVLTDEYSPQPHRSLNIVAARCKGVTCNESRFKQAMAFALVAAGNLASRRTLRWHFDRHIVQSAPGSLPISHYNDFHTTVSKLSTDNLIPALMASAAIPLALAGVENIPGSSNGLYRDGGMVDYHFDLPFDTPNGYVLYPHFAPVLKPGWFDKSLSWRRVNELHYQDVVLMTPSPAFIEKLPYGKLPDRRDFSRLSDSERHTYWRKAVGAGERLAEEFHDWMARGATGSIVMPFKSSQFSQSKAKKSTS
ncbi:patatin-like phospholipase family protein [Salinispirillum sp. LH 10-3-1]|uniref:Patatin-like phospholipase family protein n=1 Tax=Salinispirillum sp. LH 10-3-1 TaxID=2952525 RepID=A0AB38YEJ4_9GAMM